ncbi:MAG: hypothetical protein RR185_03120 [Angelakisella sp.]
MTKILQHTTDYLLSSYHWHSIRRLRTAAAKRIAQGAPFCDCRLVELSNRIERHGMAVARLQQHYRQGIPVEVSPERAEQRCV